MPELDDLINDSDADTDLVRTLRKALKEKDKEHKELQKELTERAKLDRTRTLADVLKAKGLPDKVAKLFPDHSEPTAEAVDEWLTEYADVFGIDTSGSAADPATQDAARRISAASAGAPPASAATDVRQLAAEIAAAKTPEEYKAALAKLNMGQ